MRSVNTHDRSCQTPLGDSHNYGRFVHRLATGYIQKPRCIYWEHFVLSQDSVFRNALHETMSAAGWQYQFLLPNLQCCFSADTLTGLVAPISVATVDPGTLEAQDYANIGATIALLSWLGISDLHYQNVLFGRIAPAQLLLTPIDIEGLWHDYALPSQSLLLPSRDCAAAMCGLQSLVAAESEPRMAPIAISAICRGYLEALQFLNAHADRLESTVFHAVSRRQIPIRLYVQDTMTYKAILQEEHLSSHEELLPEEVEQLQRGDIPYFFRFLDAPEIYYFDRINSYRVVSMQTRQQLRVLNDARVLSNGQLPRQHFDTLRKAGVLQLMKFLIGRWTGDIVEDGLRMCVDKASYQLRYKDTLSVRCLR